MSSEKGRGKNRASRIFATIADMGSLFMALIYITYVSALLILNTGYRVLNFCMLGVTIAYIVFFLIKIFYLNKTRLKIRRITNLSFRYTKFSMRLINAVFVVISMINVQITQNHIVAFIGIIILGISFAISVVWDFGMYFLKRKFRELMSEWSELSDVEKRDKIDFIISSFIKSLDNISGLDNYVEVGIKAGKKVGERFKVQEQPVSLAGAPKSSQETDVQTTDRYEEKK